MALNKNEESIKASKLTNPNKKVISFANPVEHDLCKIKRV